MVAHAELGNTMSIAATSPSLTTAHGSTLPNAATGSVLCSAIICNPWSLCEVYARFSRFLATAYFEKRTCARTTKHVAS